MSESVTWRRCQSCGSFAKQYLTKLGGFKVCDDCLTKATAMLGRQR